MDDAVDCDAIGRGHDGSEWMRMVVRLLWRRTVGFGRGVYFQKGVSGFAILLLSEVMND